MKKTYLSKAKRYKKIISLALPIIGGMLSHTVINLVDIAMIRPLGEAALAAVGLGGFLFYLMMSFLIGVGSGIQTQVARALGENKKGILAYPLNAGLSIMIPFSLFIAISSYILTPYIYQLLSQDMGVNRLGINYTYWRIIGLPFIAIIFSFRGYWNGIKKPMIYLYILIITHILNIFLNWIFIYGNLGAPPSGVSGAAISTSLSLCIGALIYLLLGFYLVKKESLFQVIPSWKDIKSLIKLSFPTGSEEFLHALSLMVILGIIGLIGTTEQAIANVIISISLVYLLPGIGFGLATISLVSESIGQRKPEEAKQWAWDVCKVAFIIIFTVGILSYVFAHQILSLFMPNTHSLEKALFIMQLQSITIVLEIIGLILMQALNGARKTLYVFKITTLTRWGLAIPLCYYVGIYHKGGLNSIWITLVCYHAINTILFSLRWKKINL